MCSKQRCVQGEHCCHGRRRSAHCNTAQIKTSLVALPGSHTASCSGYKSLLSLGIYSSSTCTYMHLILVPLGAVHRLCKLLVIVSNCRSTLFTEHSVRVKNHRIKEIEGLRERKREETQASSITAFFSNWLQSRDMKNLNLWIFKELQGLTQIGAGGKIVKTKISI